MTDNIIVFDPQVIKLAFDNADKISISPDGEKFILDFYKAKKQFEEAEIILKDKLNSLMEEISPDQKSIISDHVKVIRKSQYEGGRKYITEYGSGFVKERKSYYPDSEAIESYEREFGDLPEGVRRAETLKRVEVKINES